MTVQLPIYIGNNLLTLERENYNASTITSTPITTANVSEEWTYQVTAMTANPYDTLTYSAPTKPTGMTINASTGAIFAGTYPAVRANTVSSCTFDGATERYDNGSGNGVAAPLWIWTADSVAAQSISGKEFTMNSSFGGSGNKTGCSIEIIPVASPPITIGPYRILGFNNNILLLGH